jgi:predicted nucleotidyltransferase
MDYPMLSRIKQLVKLDSEIINVYPYGSRVYGTNSPSSDYDFIVVAKTDHTGKQFDSHDGDLTVHLYNHDHWLHMIDEHRIFVLECLFLPDELILQKHKDFKFTLDKTALRKEISTVSSNSWVKAKKKIEVEHEHYLGYKSLFHSLRIPMFGIQVGRDGKINDYTVANHFWKEITANIDFSMPWDKLKEHYQPIRNGILTEFREHAEK